MTEIQNDRERERKRERQRDRERDRERPKETKKERNKERERERETERQRQRGIVTRNLGSTSIHREKHLHIQLSQWLRSNSGGVSINPSQRRERNRVL